jgi:hypothetical protein
MSIKAGIYHLTHYKYDKPVRLGPQIIRLKPAAHSKTKVISHSLKVSPANHFVNLQQDPYGNYLARYVFPDPVTELKIEVDLVADMTVYNPFDFFVEEQAEHWPFDYPEDLREDLAIYRRPSRWARRSKPYEDDRPLAPAHGRHGRRPQCAVQQEIGYVIRMEPGVQTPEETLTAPWVRAAIRAGCWCRSCAISASPPASSPATSSSSARPKGARRPLRHRGRFHGPACLVRGLSSGRRLDRSRPDLRPADRRKPHPARRHPALSQRGADFGGYFGEANTEFDFDMTVTRVAEHPRITKPFSDESWEALNALGKQVDAVLDANDVRLTMGGEPTFVSIDDFESRSGTPRRRPDQAQKADTLIRRLRERFAPGGSCITARASGTPAKPCRAGPSRSTGVRDGKPIWQ